MSERDCCPRKRPEVQRQWTRLSMDKTINQLTNQPINQTNKQRNKHQILYQNPISTTSKVADILTFKQETKQRRKQIMDGSPSARSCPWLVQRSTGSIGQIELSPNTNTDQQEVHIHDSNVGVIITNCA